MKHAYTVVIPAAGSGKRMGASHNKLFLPLDDVPIIIHTLKQFYTDALCVEIRLVINFQEKEIFEKMLQTYHMEEKIVLIEGGRERQESVYHGICGGVKTSFVLVHDGARPFVSEAITQRVLQGTHEYGAATCGVPVKDTIKKVANGMVEETIERTALWAIQTPQGFRYETLLHAHEEAIKQCFFGTDDASLVEWLGEAVCVVMGDYYNIKMTTPEDILIGESFIQNK